MEARLRIKRTIKEIYRECNGFILKIKNLAWELNSIVGVMKISKEILIIKLTLINFLFNDNDWKNL